LSVGSRPEISRLSDEVTPVGHLPLPHFIAWMQPRENMNPRAEETKSAPHIVTLMASGFVKRMVKTNC